MPNPAPEIPDAVEIGCIAEARRPTFWARQIQRDCHDRNHSVDAVDEEPAQNEMHHGEFVLQENWQREQITDTSLWPEKTEDVIDYQFLGADA